MTLSRGIDGSEPVRFLPPGRPSGAQEERRIAPAARLGVGTLACPDCDAPVALARPAAPADPLGCPFCGHAGRLRDFLSLAAPSRPARVEVRVVVPPARA